MKRGIFALLLLAASSCFGQIIQGTITGNVTDASGASVPQVAVTSRNEETSITNHTTSMGSGVYSLPDVSNFLYELPFGHGKWWLSHGVVSQVAGGWTVSGIASYLSG